MYCSAGALLPMAVQMRCSLTSCHHAYWQSAGHARRQLHVTRPGAPGHALHVALPIELMSSIPSSLQLLPRGNLRAALDNDANGELMWYRRCACPAMLLLSKRLSTCKPLLLSPLHASATAPAATFLPLPPDTLPTSPDRHHAAAPVSRTVLVGAQNIASTAGPGQEHRAGHCARAGLPALAAHSAPGPQEPERCGRPSFPNNS